MSGGFLTVSDIKRELPKALVQMPLSRQRKIKVSNIRVHSADALNKLRDITADLSIYLITIV